MNIISDRDEDESKAMTLYCKISASNPYNTTDTSKTAAIIDYDDEFETKEKLLKD